MMTSNLGLKGRGEKVFMWNWRNSLKKDMEVRNRLRLEGEVMETDQGRRGDMRGTRPAAAGKHTILGSSVAWLNVWFEKQRKRLCGLRLETAGSVWSPAQRTSPSAPPELQDGEHTRLFWSLLPEKQKNRAHLFSAKVKYNSWALDVSYTLQPGRHKSGSEATLVKAPVSLRNVREERKMFPLISS